MGCKKQIKDCKLTCAAFSSGCYSRNYAEVAPVVEQPIRNPAVNFTVIWNQQFTCGLFGSIWLIRGDLEGFRYSLCTAAQAHLISISLPGAARNTPCGD
jgi:hypothetical protein